jgi:protein-S-isoprenylcysteine O-methyltransferase Ste14
MKNEKQPCPEHAQYFLWMMKTIMPPSQINSENSYLTERRNRRKNRRYELFQLIMTVLQSFSLLYTLFYNYYYLEYSSSKLQVLRRVIFLLFTLCCFICWLIARIQLGTFLTFEPKAHSALVTSGIYSKFRHPIYYFGSLALFFFFLLIEKYYYILVFVVLLPLQVIRAAKENRVLKEKFDDVYLEYMQQLWL